MPVTFASFGDNALADAWDTFSNQDLVHRLEGQGAECWMADIAEWIAYTNVEEVRNLRLAGWSYSWEMIKSKLRSRIQHADEHALRKSR